MTIVPSETTVGVCGAGQMGAALAVCLQRAGYRAILWLRDAGKIPTVETELTRLGEWLDAHVGPQTANGGTVEITADLASVDAAADVVVDCIAEEIGQKADLFRRVPQTRKRGGLFLTSTSGLSISEIGRQSGTGPQLVGTHFWNPPHLMPLVEVIRGAETTDAALERADELVRSIGKIPVRVNRDVPGFIGNRLLHALFREAIALVQSGVASAADVDRVARLCFGLRLPAVGPLENMDLVGLDLVQTIHDYLLSDLADDHDTLPILREHVANGELGMKTGVGFHDWRTRDPQQLIERRDRQIVRQLEFLREQDAL